MSRRYGDNAMQYARLYEMLMTREDLTFDARMSDVEAMRERRNAIVNGEFPEPQLRAPRLVHEPPTQERLRQLYDYDAETGDIVHKARPADYYTDWRAAAAFNAKMPGLPVFTRSGAVSIYVSGHMYQLSRLCWCMYYGVFPTSRIKFVFDRTSEFRYRITNLASSSGAEEAHLYRLGITPRCQCRR